jgi:hypothetical protein
VDGGVTWLPQNTGTRLHSLEDVCFPLNVQTGFAVGASGGIVKTTSGGVSFVEEERAEAPAPRFGLSLKVLPNPFTSFATVPGFEAQRFAVYDITGRKVAIHKGDRVGEGLAPGVYFLKPEGQNTRPLRVVKVR